MLRQVILRSARFAANETRDARVVLVQPVYVFPQMRITSVKFIAQIAVVFGMLRPSVSAEFFKRAKVGTAT